MAERANLPRPIEALCSIAEAIGLDPLKQRITAIDVHATARELPRIVVTMLMDVDGQGRLCEVVKRYRLEEYGAEPLDDPETALIGLPVEFEDDFVRAEFDAELARLSVKPPIEERCPDCDGSGRFVSAPFFHGCMTCGGTGRNKVVGAGT